MDCWLAFTTTIDHSIAKMGAVVISRGLPSAADLCDYSYWGDCFGGHRDGVGVGIEWEGWSFCED